MKTLLLTRHDIQKIFGIKEAIRVAEKTFRSFANGKTQMPEKSYLYLPKYRGDFRSMPAYVEDQNAVGVKWVNVHTDNFKQKLPTVMAMIILGDSKTGYPLAVMDGTYITNLRTGAAGAIAAKYLARKDSSVVALIGTGNQARTQLEGLRQSFKIKEIRVWSSDSKSDERFIKSCHSKSLNCHPERSEGSQNRRSFAVLRMTSVKECVQNADIIVTTTPSRKPLVHLAWVKRGAHINAIGADAKGKIELEPKILQNSKVIIDDWAQASHSGEINVAVSKGLITKRDIHATLGDIILGKKKGRTSESEITVFDSTGLSIQDIASAHFIYEHAQKKHLGKSIAFF